MKLTYRLLQEMLNGADLTEAQKDLTVTGCSENGDLLEATMLQTTDNGSTVIDPATPILVFALVG